MARRSKLALIAFAALVLAALWWLSPTVNPVVSPTAVAASEHTDQPEVALPSVEALPSAPDRALAAGVVADQPAGALEAKATPPTAGPASIRLMGTMLDPKGQPFLRPETAVELISGSGVRQMAMLDNGQYSYEGLRPGQYALQTRIPGYKHVDLTVTLRPDEPVHREDIRIEDAWTITVHLLTPEGDDLRIRLEEERFSYTVQPSILCTIDSPGDHLQPSLLMDRSHDGVGLETPYLGQGQVRDDRIYILAEPPIYVSVIVRDQVLATQKVQDFVSELTFVLSVDRFRALLCGLTVRVVDGDTGLPATGAGVNLITDQSVESDLHPDEQGFVRYRDRVPGLYEVHAHLKGFARETRTVKLEPGGIADLGTITLRKGILIQGRCVDGEGIPRRVPASLTPLSKNPSTDQGPATLAYLLKVDDQGHFSIASLPAGRYSVHVSPRPIGIGDEGELGWASAPLVVDTRNGPMENLVIVVQRPVTTTLHPIASEVRGMRFKVITTDGLEYSDGEFFDSAAIGLELVPGVYNIRLSRGLGLVREVPLTVGTSPVTIDVAP